MGTHRSEETQMRYVAACTITALFCVTFSADPGWGQSNAPVNAPQSTTTNSSLPEGREREETGFELQERYKALDGEKKDIDARVKDLNSRRMALERAITSIKDLAPTPKVKTAANAVSLAYKRSKPVRSAGAKKTLSGMPQLTSCLL